MTAEYDFTLSLVERHSPEVSLERYTYTVEVSQCSAASRQSFPSIAELDDVAATYGIHHPERLAVVVKDENEDVVVPLAPMLDYRKGDAEYACEERALEMDDTVYQLSLEGPPW